MTTSNTTEIDLGVDPDLQNLMDDLVSGFSGPDVEPDPDAVWATLTEVGLARLTAPEESGGSGAGCSASVLAAHILPRLLSGQEKRVLFMATGSLMSQTTFLQKESIPCIAHLVELESPLNGVKEEEE